MLVVSDKINNKFCCYFLRLPISVRQRKSPAKHLLFFDQCSVELSGKDSVLANCYLPNCYYGTEVIASTTNRLRVWADVRILTDSTVFAPRSSSNGDTAAVRHLLRAW